MQSQTPKEKAIADKLVKIDEIKAKQFALVDEYAEIKKHPVSVDIAKRIMEICFEIDAYEQQIKLIKMQPIPNYITGDRVVGGMAIMGEVGAEMVVDANGIANVYNIPVGLLKPGVAVGIDWADVGVDKQDLHIMNKDGSVKILTGGIKSIP